MLTVVLISCDELTKPLSKLSAGNVLIKEINNVYPQIDALNAMIDCVDTEFFIELNADMILHDNWLERIKNKISSWTDQYSSIFNLWDTFTQEKILALKIFKTSIMKENRFRDVPTPDIEHYQRITKEYRLDIESLKEVPIGYHVVKGQKYCYAKYKDVYKTLRTHQFAWDAGVFKGGSDVNSRSKNHAEFFEKRYYETGDCDYLAGMAGMMDGLTCELDGKSKSYENFNFKYEINEGVFKLYKRKGKIF